jgi:hypothetical protein
LFAFPEAISRSTETSARVSASSIACSAKSNVASVKASFCLREPF